MGFLQQMFSGRSTENDTRCFLIEAMLGAMEADGEITAEELSSLHQTVDEHEIFQGLTGEQTSRMIDVAANAIREAGGGRARVAAIAEGLPSRGHRMAAYGMACEVCVSDGELPESEIAYLDALQGSLGIESDDAKEIFEAARRQSGLLTLEEKTAKMRALMPRFVDCMALMAAADGEIHEEERDGIRAVLREIPDMSVLTKVELETAICASFARIDGQPVNEELADIATTITHAADRYWTAVYMMIVALADGKTDWREVAFLKTVQTSFSLSDDQMDEGMRTASLFPRVAIGGAVPN